MKRDGLVGRADAKQIFVLLAITAMAACATAGSDLPQVTSDGLELTEVDGIQVAYVKPGASLAAYNRVLLDPVTVDFASDFDPMVASTGLPLSDSEKEDIRDGAAELFMEAFQEELTNNGYEIATGAGPDILRVTPALVDLYVTAPNNRSATGMTRTYTMNAGRVTLAAELRDSRSSDLLARVFDAQAARQTATLQMAGPVRNQAEARRIFRDWARILRERLDAAKSGN